MERRTYGWREARAQAAAGLGHPVLARSRTACDRALFDLAIDSKLRGCDVVKIRISELVSGGRVRTRATVVQQKTGRPVQFELLEAARSSLQTWLEHRGGTLDDYAFSSMTDRARHIRYSAICQAGRRVRDCDRVATRGLWHALAPPDQGIDHLQGPWQSAGGAAAVQS